MTDLFLKLLNMSISASWLVLAVILLRVFLRKAPKWISCLLWGIVALRLVIPFTLESVFSLIPSAEVIPQDIAVSQTPAIHSGIPAVNSVINPLFTEHLSPEGNALETVLSFAAAVWLAGMVLMLLYGAVSYLKLRRQVRASILLRNRVYICDDVDSPFILGIFRPGIYVPSGLEENLLQHVLAHESAHLKRRDHLWKPVGFLLLTVYWFNPLLWLAYILLCRDIECACDQKVIAGMDNAGKKDYSEALAACSVHRRMVMACPVAFGEVGVKDRIKGVLNYKRPAFWIILVSVAACGITAVCFLTNPKPCKHEYQGEITVDATCTRKGVETLTCTRCKHSYTVPVELLAHAYDAGIVTVEPTCTQRGSKELSCIGCGVVKTEAVEKTAHSYDAVTVVTEPTCTQLGSERLGCIVCGTVKTKEIAKIAHTAGPATVTAEPNCTETGERSTGCTACHTVLTVETIETNGVHDLKETVLREATCTASGEGVRTCTRCSHSESCTYEKRAHHYKDGVTVPSTCTRLGQKQAICTGCGDEQWTDLTEFTEHRWTDAVIGPDYCVFCHKYNPDSEPKREYDLLEDVTYQRKDPDDLFPVIRIWP